MQILQGSLESHCTEYRCQDNMEVARGRMGGKAVNAGSMDGFPLRYVALEEPEETNTLVLGLSDIQDGSGNTLIIERGLSYDEQDAALGQDTYSISTASGATVYSGIIRCVSNDQVLTLDFTAEAADGLGITHTCQFPLELDLGSIERLRKGLRRVFEDESSASLELSI